MRIISGGNPLQRIASSFTQRIEPKAPKSVLPVPHVEQVLAHSSKPKPSASQGDPAVKTVTSFCDSDLQRGLWQKAMRDPQTNQGNVQPGNKPPTTGYSPKPILTVNSTGLRS